MPAWSDLSTGDLRALVAFSLSAGAREPGPPDAQAAVIDLPAVKNLYTKNCAICHGDEGAGNGRSARVLAPPPTNFRQVQPTLAHAERALALGVPGTAMPPWEAQLSLDHRRALAHYVRTFFQPDPPAPE
jgi:mono/diheme cytochrome c family protein